MTIFPEKKRILENNFLEHFKNMTLKKEFNIESGRSYWHIKNLLNKKLIVKTDEKLSLLEKGKVYAVYRVSL